MKEFVYSWDYTLPTTQLAAANAGRAFYRAFGNPNVIVSAGLMTMTYDDIVTRTLHFTSADDGSNSWWVTGNLCPIDNNRQTIFQIDNPSTQYWPCVRGTATGRFLGGARYGSPTFSNFAGLSGQQVNSSSLTYAMYVDGENGLVAFRVNDGSNVYNSGFVPITGSDKGARRWSFVTNNTGGEDGTISRFTTVYGAYEMSLSELSAVYYSDLEYIPMGEFSIQPQNLIAVEGDTVTFRAGATPSDCIGTSLIWRWYKNGTLISGADKSSLVISAITANDFDSYLVQFQTGVTTRTSDEFFLIRSEVNPVSGINFYSDYRHSPSPGYFRIHFEGVRPLLKGESLVFRFINDYNLDVVTISADDYSINRGFFDVELEGLSGQTYTVRMYYNYLTNPEG